MNCLQLVRPVLATALATTALAGPLLAAPRQESGVLPDGRRIEISGGDYVLWDAFGEKLIEGSIEAGKADGRFRFFHPGGEKSALGKYRDGQRIGTWKFYDRNGALVLEAKYLEGTPRGEWTRYAPAADGTSTLLDTLEVGWGELGRGEGGLVDGEPHGIWAFHWDGGEPCLVARVDRGRVMEALSLWHRDGTPDPCVAPRPSEDPLLPPFSLEVPALPGLDEDVRPAAGLPGADLPAAAAGRLPEFDPDLDPEQVERFRAAYGTLTTPGASQEQLQRAVTTLQGDRRGALAFFLTQLRECDLASAEGLRRARLLLDRTRFAVGDAFDPGVSIQDRIRPEMTPTMELTIRRLDTLYHSHPEGSLFWRIGIEAMAGPGSEGDSCLPISGRWLFGAREAPPYSARDARKSGGSGTRAPLEDALAWISRHQHPDGSWGGKDAPASCTCNGWSMERHAPGITGLALTALLRRGPAPLEGPYRPSIVDGLGFLVSLQDSESGYIGRYRGGDTIYSHCLATQALALAYGATGEPSLRTAAQRGVDWIETARNKYGGWRYSVPPKGDNDTSVTGVALLALHSAREAGLRVPEASLTHGLALLREYTDPANGRIGYNEMGTASARDPQHNADFPRDGDETLTALGLYCQQLLDPELDPDRASLHGDLLLRSLPVHRASEDWRDADPASSTNFMYYWRWGTPAMRELGGKHWRTWSHAVKDALLEARCTEGCAAGSWNPSGPWGVFGGRVYSTAMMAMCLQTYYVSADGQ